MKVFYSDVDDTLILQQGISEEIEQFLKYMSKKEEYFVPCSGRPLVSMTKTFSKYNLKYVIAYNGGQIYDLKEKKIIYNNYIPKEEAKSIIEELEKLNIDYLTYEEDTLYTNNLENKYAKIESVICDEPLTLQTQIKDTPKILGLIDPTKNDEMVKKLKQKFKDVEIFKSKDFFIEITPLGVTKGRAIINLNEKLNVINENTYCFGDSHNDIPMFELDIHKVAVGNAHEIIKKLADEITLSCEQAGVAKYIKKLYGDTNE